jgi:uncharacterized protein
MLYLAFDRRLVHDRRPSVRSYDQDGRLHVSVANISRAGVNEYLCSEIPGWQKLGLTAGRRYRLLRDPDELRKAAPSFNNLPVLSQHVAVTAVDHRPDIVIGATGSDATFDNPFLTNSLVIWSADAIARIEDGSRRELSAGYRYFPLAEPGTFKGQPYDLRMTEIVGSHLATVADGRAGPDVVVGDSARSAARRAETFAPGISRIQIGVI